MKMNNNKLNIAALLSTLLLGGCGSVLLEPPKSNIPSVFTTKNIKTKESLNLNPNWWLLFEDKNLNSLIDYSLKNNTDLAIAVLNIKNAQSALELTEIDKGAKHDVRAKIGGEKNFNTGERGESNSISYSFSYELDLWNALGSAYNAKEWALSATEQEKEATKLSLISSVISLYYQAIFLNETISMAEESVKHSKKLLSITETKFKVGRLSGLELAQAKTSVIQQEYYLNEYKQKYFENINSLKALLNLNPSEEFPEGIIIPKKIPPRVFKNIKSDIPSNILKNRPDVLAAQMRIQEAFYNVKEIEAEFYPKISLTGSLGNSTAELLRFINNPIGTIAANISLPILDYGKNKENLRIGENKYNIYALEYQKTLVKAMGEVENRISFYYYNKDNYEKIAEVYKEKTKIRKIYEVRYNSGVAPLQDLLEAQENERSAYLNKLQHIYNLITSESQVYQALGGKYDD